MTSVPFSYYRTPLILLFIVILVCIATVIAPPAGQLSWLLEVGPGLAGIAVLIALYRRFPMSHMAYWCVFFHMFILIYGGYYTYAKTPLGNWAMEVFGFSRNHYDRVGHVALGVFPVFIIREILLRVTPLQKGGWFYFIVFSIVLAIAAFWELLEWWIALIAAPDVGTAFLGSQGDIWDAQWDMFLALVGAMVAVPLFYRLHDRSMARLGKFDRHHLPPPKDCEMIENDMMIRKATPADHERIIAALQNWWGGRDLTAMLPKLFLNHFNDTSFVIEKEAEMIGFLIGFISPSLKNEAYVHFMGVHPDFRKKGIGTLLYERFFEICRNHGRNIVRACTSPVNRGSVEFHKRIGFQLEPGDDEIDGFPVTHNYNRPGDHKVQFTKFIKK